MRLLKNLIAILFLIVILFIVAIVYLSKFDNQSLLGKKVKNRMIRSPFLLSIVNYNGPGDARYVYLTTSDPLRVDVIYAENADPNPEVNQWLKEMVFSTTGKHISIDKVLNSDISLQSDYSDNDLNSIHKSLISVFRQTPGLNVIYLTKYQNQPSLAGLTRDRDTIFIFKQTLQELSENEEIVRELEKSTLMHEWGHLLDLEHINNDACIMNDKVEVYGSQAWLNNLPTEYCSEELQSLKPGNY